MGYRLSLSQKWGIPQNLPCFNIASAQIYKMTNPKKEKGKNGKELLFLENSVLSEAVNLNISELF